MKICTIFTGGTIGSRLNISGRISPDETSPYRLLEMFKEKYQENITFITKEPYCILSENLNAGRLRLLIDCVNTTLMDQTLNGIIITHGTDTLQYSAAILDYIFGNARIPIVLVSSDFILDDKRANGLTNFYHAIRFIEEANARGVFVSYKNTHDIPYIHRGTRLSSPYQLSADLNSVKNSYYARFEEKNGTTVLVKNPEYYISPDNMPCFGISPEKIRLHEDASMILRILPYVGMPYPNPSAHTRAVLHESYHSGTICISRALEAFCQETAKRNIPVFLTGLSSSEAAYETVASYQKLNIIPLRESASIAQYCKLWLALSNDIPPAQLMLQSVAQDIISPKA